MKLPNWSSKALYNNLTLTPGPADVVSTTALFMSGAAYFQAVLAILFTIGYTESQERRVSTYLTDRYTRSG